MGQNEVDLISEAWAAFAGIGEASIKETGLVSGSRIRRIDAGTMLIEQGESGRSVYLVLSGSLKVVWYTSNGHEIWLSEITEGEIVGEFAALSGGVRSSSVIAIEPVQLSEISIARFRNAMNTSIDLSNKIASILSERLRATTQQMIALVGLPLAARLHAELQRIGERDLEDSESVIVSEPPTVSQLAEKIHASREATSRAFSTLQRRGLVSRKDNTLQVIVPNVPL